MRIFRFPLLVLTLAASALAAPRPRLLVVISVDQLSADLVARWGADLPGGLGKLLREGTHFASAYHEHGYTETGPGHSVLLSGRHPGHTGIPENDWYDPAIGKWVYCVDDPTLQTLGLSKKGGSGPHRFLGTTLAGWLKEQVPGARAFVVGGKDRSTILMAGPKADAVYWFEGAAGFTTSTAYAKALPPWLAERNRALVAKLVDSSLVWTPLDPTEVQPATVRYQLPGRIVAMGLPRQIKGLGMPMDEAFWTRFKTSPMFDAETLDTAEALLAAEGLGREGSTDLLGLALSGSDYIGHTFGNAGPEMRDQLRRLDRRLGEFLERVRSRDPGAWVVLTSDHACADFCERLQEQGIAARRVIYKDWLAAIEQQLASALGSAGPFLIARAGANQVWLRDESVKASGRKREEVLAVALAVLRKQPEIAAAWTGAELQRLAVDAAANPDQRSVPERLKLSQAAGRYGEIMFALAPLMTFDSPPNVVSHGNPWDFDRRVPLLFWGPWLAEVRRDKVRTVDLAPTLAKELGLTPSESLDGKALQLNPKGSARLR